MTEPLMVTDFATLTRLLNEDAVPYRRHPTDEIVEIPFEEEGMRAAMLVRWLGPQNVVQFLIPVPIDVPADRVDALLHGMARINQHLSIQGFGYDHGSNRVVYRLGVAVRPGGLTRTEITGYFRMATRVCARYAIGLRAVATGADPADVKHHVPHPA